MRIDKVYTRGGDKGETSLIGGNRTSKAALRIHCYGTVDELNATIGLVLEALRESAAREFLAPILVRVQNELFNLGAVLAAQDWETAGKLPQIEAGHVSALERDIDAVNDELPALKSFVLPGGGWPSAYCHLARTTCRRAERLVVELAETEDEYVKHEAIEYLNRLSDALFVWGRWCVLKDGRDEPLWDSRST